MAQINKKTRICKSFFIATVVAIRAVVKNGFQCIAQLLRPRLESEDQIDLDLDLGTTANSGTQVLTLDVVYYNWADIITKYFWLR